jgi:cytidyltransferase-like protein
MDHPPEEDECPRTDSASVAAAAVCAAAGSARYQDWQAAHRMGDPAAANDKVRNDLLYTVLPAYIIGLAPVALFALLWPVLFPKTEPLEVDDDQAGDATDTTATTADKGRGRPAKKKERVRRERGSVILAGSFNPPHKGHVAMLSHLSKRYQKVYAVIGFNPSKTYAVTPEQRSAVLKTMVEHLENVEPVTVRGYIWRFALEKRAVAVYRGIRSWRLDGAAERFLELQNRVGPPLMALTWPYATTFLCLPEPPAAAAAAGDDTAGGSVGLRLDEVSSTAVRTRCAANNAVTPFWRADFQTQKTKSLKVMCVVVCCGVLL